MPIICPTVTAFNPHQYREQLERLRPFAKRIHLDLMDGVFTETKSIEIEKLYWFDEFEQVDIHVMFDKPSESLDSLLQLKPDLIVVTAEANDNIEKVLKDIKETNIRAGLSILQQTEVKDVAEAVKLSDHILIFSGALGSFGGTVDFRLLDKVQQIRKLNPDAEIGWDGGINDENAKDLIEGGIEVLNVGGFIQRSEDSEKSFNTLNNLL